MENFVKHVAAATAQRSMETWRIRVEKNAPVARRHAASFDDEIAVSLAAFLLAHRCVLVEEAEVTDLQMNSEHGAAAQLDDVVLSSQQSALSSALGEVLADRLDAIAASSAGRLHLQGDHDMLMNSLVQSDAAVLVGLRADLARHEAWDAGRRRHQPWGSRPHRGFADGTARALAAAQSLTLVCGNGGCTALVHYPAARRQANTAGRDSYAPGDGCGSKACSGGSYRPGQFADNQLRMAAKLQASGERPLEERRHLICWPDSVAAREVLVQPRAVALEAARVASATAVQLQAARGVASAPTRRSARVACVRTRGGCATQAVGRQEAAAVVAAPQREAARPEAQAARRRQLEQYVVAYRNEEGRPDRVNVRERPNFTSHSLTSIDHGRIIKGRVCAGECAHGSGPWLEWKMPGGLGMGFVLIDGKAIGQGRILARHFSEEDAQRERARRRQDESEDETTAAAEQQRAGAAQATRALAREQHEAAEAAEAAHREAAKVARREVAEAAAEAATQAAAAQTAAAAETRRMAEEAAARVLDECIARAVTWRRKPQRSAAAKKKRGRAAAQRKHKRARGHAASKGEAGSDGGDGGGDGDGGTSGGGGGDGDGDANMRVQALLAELREEREKRLATAKALGDRTKVLALTRKHLRRETKTAKARWQQLARKSSKASKKLSRKLFTKQARAVAGAARREQERTRKRKHPEGEILHSAERKHQRLAGKGRGSGSGIGERGKGGGRGSGKGSGRGKGKGSGYGYGSGNGGKGRGRGGRHHGWGQGQ